MMKNSQRKTDDFETSKKSELWTVLNQTKCLELLFVTHTHTNTEL